MGHVPTSIGCKVTAQLVEAQPANGVLVEFKGLIETNVTGNKCRFSESVLRAAVSTNVNAPSGFALIFGIQSDHRRYAPPVDDIVAQVRANERGNMTAMFIANNESHLSRLTEGFYDTASLRSQK